MSTLYAEFKREQDQKTIRRLQLVTFYNDVLSQYNKSKKLRRLLKALVSRHSALTPDEAESLYTDLLIQLEDIQLEFESLRRQVTVQGRTFPEQSKILVNLTKIQKFLREVVREYEEGTISRKADISASNLPCLSRFVLEQGGDFVQYVAIPFEEVEAVLLRELDRRT